MQVPARILSLITFADVSWHLEIALDSDYVSQIPEMWHKPHQQTQEKYCPSLSEVKLS